MLLRGTILIRTYGKDKKQYISLFLLPKPYVLKPPLIVPGYSTGFRPSDAGQAVFSQEVMRQTAEGTRHSCLRSSNHTSTHTRFKRTNPSTPWLKVATALGNRFSSASTSMPTNRDVKRKGLSHSGLVWLAYTGIRLFDPISSSQTKNKISCFRGVLITSFLSHTETFVP